MKHYIMATVIALSCAAMLQPAEAGKKKRSDFSTEQQKKIFENGLKKCRSKYGNVANVRVDYAHNRYICYIS